ncbi:MAG TPA: PilN domain-containing protein [Candidatus Baltobacteraceae bacterium]
MTDFDYLRDSQPAFVRNLTALRIPPNHYNALLALGAAFVVVFAAWCIEAYRLQSALALQSVYQARYDRSRDELARTKVLYGRVERLVTLDRQIRDIARSGDDEARKLTDIANRLSPHVWLTAVTQDETGTTLEGRALGLAGISRTVSSFARGKLTRDPVLLDAHAVSNDGEGLMRYRVRVEDSRR